MCSCLHAFINLAASLAFYLFSPTRLINSVNMSTHVRSSIFVCSWGTFSIVAGEHDLTYTEGTEQEINATGVVVVSRFY